MSIHLVIEDPMTAISFSRKVEEGEPWPLREAIEKLAQEVARSTDAEPYTVLFSLQPNFFVRLEADEE